MTQALAILEKAATVLQDPDYVRWTKEEMLVWLSEGQMAIARTPGAYTKTKVVDLVEGTRQVIPADAWALLTVSHNVDEDGTALGAVRISTRAILDCYEPNWHMATEKPLVETFVYDDRFPREFNVYPPNDGTGRLEVTYSAIPEKLTSETDELELEQMFEPALLSYVLYRANSKDSDYAPGLQAATAYFQAYSQEVQAGLAIHMSTSPNASVVSGPVKPSGATS